MRQRIILHCDLNNFFASVACLQNPELREKAIAVCGDPAQRKGIVLAKSEPAKKCGVKTGMAIWQAKQLCPDLIVVSTDYAAYERYSKQVKAIYYRFTNQVESFGIDECWLDVTNSQKMFGTGLQIAEQIRQIVKNETGLTISVGVSFNKTYAKLGSDLAAPNSVYVINVQNYQQLVYPLPLTKMLFVGKKTQILLQKLNIKTIGELANYDVKILHEFIGINAEKLIAAARGEDYQGVGDYLDQIPPKSVGNGTTLPYDLTTVAMVTQVIYLLAEKVAYRLRKRDLQGYTISLAVRSQNLTWVGAQESLPYATHTVQTLVQVATRIFDKIWVHGHSEVAPVRSLRIAVSNLTSDKTTQIDLFNTSQQEIKNQALAVVFDKVRRKYGTQQIMFGGTPRSYQKLGFKLDFYECDDY